VSGRVARGWKRRKDRLPLDVASQLIRKSRIFEPVQPGLAGGDNVDVAVLVHIAHDHLQASASRSAPKIRKSIPLFNVHWRRWRGLAFVDDRSLPLRRFTIESKPIEAGCVRGPGFADVCVNAFSSDEFQQSIAVKVGQVQRVNLRETRVDVCLGSGTFSIGIGRLLQPMQPEIVPHAPDDVRVAITVEVMRENLDAGHS